MIQCYQVMTFKLPFLCVISDFHNDVNEMCTLMKCYAVYISSVSDVSEQSIGPFVVGQAGRFETCRSLCHGSSRTFRNLSVSLSWVKQDVSETVGPFVMGQAGRSGTCRSLCHGWSRTFRNLSVPLSWVKQDVSEPIGPFVMSQAGRFGTYRSLCHGSSRTFRNILSIPSSWVKQSLSPWTAWPMMKGTTGCNETSVTYYQPTFRNISDERRSHTF